MTTRNVNYFGTFLDTMGSRSRSRRSDNSDWEPAQITPSPDSLDEILKALVGKDDLGAKELVQQTGLSLSSILTASIQLAEYGWVNVSKPFALHLTEQGRELAEALQKNGRPN